MKTLLLGLFLAGIAFSTAQQLNNIPELNIAFDFNILEIIKTNLVAPLVNQKAQNITLAANFPVALDHINGNITNITLVSLDVDWENTHLLQPYGTGNSVAVEINNLNAVANFNADLTIMDVHLAGDNNNFTLKGVDAFIAIGYGNYSNGTVYAYIDTVTLTIKSLEPQFSNTFAKIIMDTINLFHIDLGSIVADTLTKQIKGFNDTVKYETSRVVTVEFLDLLRLNATLAQTPVVFNVDGDAYQTLGLNFLVENLGTGQVVPFVSTDNLPPYVDGLPPVQLIIGEAMISQILWGVFQTDLINLTLSQNNTPASVPVSLNSSDLVILFPNISNEFGADKGVYINVQKGGDYPISYLRDGRLVLDLGLILNVYVDQDSSQYPTQGLANCTTCPLAIELNLTAFVAVDLYQYNATAIGAKVIDVDLNEVQLVSGDLDVAAFQAMLNELLVSMLGQINEQLGAGIQIPDIGILGMLGINNTALMISNDSLIVALDMQLLPTPNTTLFNELESLSSVIA